MHDDFLQTIIDHPDDDGPRLVYADWLEEHGDAARAEFIRAQCELATLVEFNARRQQLAWRCHELRQSHASSWLGPLAEIGGLPTFHRGFLDTLRMSADRFLEHGRRLDHAPAIPQVELIEAAGRLEPLAACPWLRHVTSIQVDADYPSEESRQRCRAVGDNAIRALVLSRHPKRLRELLIGGCSVTAHGIAALAAAPAMQTLVELRLANNPIGPEGLQALLDAPYLRQLRSLHVMGTDQTPAALRRLAESDLLARLTELALGFDPFGVDGLQALVNSPKAAGLRRFWLMFIGMNLRDLDELPRIDGTCAVLAESQVLRLGSLRIYGTTESAADLRALLNSPAAAKLTELCLYDCGIDASAMNCLNAWQGLKNLSELCLPANPIDNDSICSLLESPFLGFPSTLSFMETGITDRGAFALKASPNLDRLQELNLRNNTLGLRAKRALTARFGDRVLL